METVHARSRDSALSDRVHDDLLRFFPELVAELGGDPEALLSAAGIDPAVLARGTTEVSYSGHFALLERTAQVLACHDFGLRLATRQAGLRIFGPLGPVMRNSRTFGEALRYVADHAQAHSLAAQIWLKADPIERTIFSGHDVLLAGSGARAQAVEQIMLLGHLGAIELTGGVARVRRVHFRHQAALPPAIYRRYFGCDVAFGQDDDGVFFRESDFAAPIVEPDARRWDEAAAYIDAAFGDERQPLEVRVRGLVLRELEGDRSGNEAIAAALGMNVRMLHRALRLRETSFQKVKDEARRDKMLYLLRHTAFDFGEISARLGFAEQAVMTRFCRRALGVSPTTIRTASRRADVIRAGAGPAPAT